MTKKLICALTLTTLFASFSFAESIDSETEKAAQNLGANTVSEIGFEQGKSDLKGSEADELRDVVAQASQAGKIHAVKVIAWADREYPANGAKASSADVKLAEARADRVKKFLTQELKLSSVTAYNMAKRPNALQELFKSSDSKVKGTLEETGAAPTSREDTGFLGLRGKASEVIVLVYNK